MIYQGIYMYLIQKHKIFKKIAKNLKGHYTIKKKKKQQKQQKKKQTQMTSLSLN